MLNHIASLPLPLSTPSLQPCMSVPMRMYQSSPAAETRQAVLFDAALDDRDLLAAGARHCMEVGEFGGSEDGLAQLQVWASAAEQYDVLHLLCHGAPGRLQLGSFTLDRAALSLAQVQDALRTIGQSLGDGGSVLLYSCHVAQGEEGAAFVAELALAMGVPVAASAGPVGVAALGGSWALSYRSGHVAASALSWPDYQHTLATAPQLITTFANAGNAAFANATASYPAATVLQANDVAGTGWDVTAQSSSGGTGTSFVIRGVSSIGSDLDPAQTDTYSLRTNATDIDYVIFKSNLNGHYFDLTSFDIINPQDSNFTIQAMDASGALIGTAVAFFTPKQVLGSPPIHFTNISLAGNADFLHIYGFKLTFPAPRYIPPNGQPGETGDAPLFDNIVVANIGTPVFPTTTVSTATISADSGTPGDYITNIAAQTISGTLSAALSSGESVQVSYNGGTTWVAASTFAVGSSTWSTTGTLLTGTNTLMTRVSNADGSTAAVSHSYRLDTTAPTAPAAPVMTSGTDTGVLQTDAITSNTAPVFTGIGEVGATVQLYDTDGTTGRGSATVDGSGNWSITSTGLTEASHTLTVRQTDIAGNVSAASTGLVMRIDATAPTAVALSSNSATTSTATANTAVATLSSTDASAVTYALAIGSGSSSSGNNSFTLSGNTLSVGNTPLTAGTYNIYLSATDVAGNVSYLAQTFTVTTVPTVTSIVRAGGASAGVLTDATSVSYTVTFSESVTHVDASDFALTVSGSASGTISGITGSGSTYTVTVNTLAGDGAMRLDLKSSGTGIQSGTSVAVSGGYTAGDTYTLDHTAPSAPLALAMNTLDDTGPNTDNITTVQTPTFTGTAEAGSTVKLYDTDGITVLGSDVATGGNWTITSTTLSEGSHTLRARAIDAAGNVSAVSAALVVVIDRTVPSDPALSNNTVATANASNGATVATLSSSDASAITYALATGNGTNNANNSSFTISGNALVSNAQLTPGTYHIYLSATDAAGNVSYAPQTIVVADAPIINSIVRAGGAGATVANNATSADFTVTFSQNVTGVDISDFVLTILNGTPGGAISAISGNDNIYTVTINNLSGDGQLRLDLKNSGTSIQNGSNIAIANGYSSGSSYTLDHTAPAAPSALDLRTLDDKGSSNTDNITNVTTPELSGTAESGSTITLYDTNGTTVLGTTVATGGSWSFTPTLTDGSHSLTVTATDAAGNVSAASPALTVIIDTTAPTGLALSQTTVASGTTGPGATVATLSGVDINGPLVYALDNINGNGTNDSGNGNFDLVGNVLSVRGSGLLAGSYNVYLSATDAAGNVSHLAQTINVVNAPSVTTIVRAGGASANVAASATSATFTVNFSESVSGVDTSDFALTTTNTASGTVSNVTGSGTTYTVTVSGLSGDGQLRLDLNPAGTGIVNGSAVGILGGYSSGASYVLDHIAPLAPSSASMTSATDTGSSTSDGTTSNTTPSFTGTAEANATVRLYDTDGITVLTTVTANGSGNWTMSSVALSEGSHTLTVRQTDVAGNISPASSAVTVVIDTSAAAPAAPTLAPASDSGILGDRITNNNSPTINGTAEAFAAITLYATDGVTILGMGTANGSGAWSIVPWSPLADGTHTLTVSQTDRAGNISTLSAGLMLTIDTISPVAPGIPVLAVASDSGTAGDNITNITQPVVTGSALANATVRLYDTNGTTVLGTATADSSGNWSITSSTLSVGVHTLVARQLDAAGNVSPAGVALNLTIEAPPAPPVTPQPPMIDGVPVTQQPVTLPGGGSGTQTVIPIVTNTRNDDTGNSAVADIPLASSGGTSLLVAQVQAGFGLTATGGASAPAGDPLQQLIQAIMAATPDHASNDQGHLTGNGTTFLNQTAASVPLLVQTIIPISSSTTTGGTLTLTGTSTTEQRTALVIETGNMPAGATLQLNAVDFAAIVGAANVVGSTNGQILTGDQAAQQFTVSSGTSSNVFSGGGNDTLLFNTAAPAQAAALPGNGAARVQLAATATPATVTSVLHGGLGIDTATFNGASSDYTIVRHQSYVTVASTVKPQQQAVLINVESLKFSDTTLAVETKESLTAIAGLYRDVLGRQADYLGIDSWARSELAGASLGEIAIGIIKSVESQARQARVFNGDNAHDIELLYQSIFSRPSDAGGLAHWVQFMREGTSLEQVATQFMLSEEMQAHKIGVPQWDFSMG